MQYWIDHKLLPKTGYNCLFSNISDISKFYGYPLKEYEIFFLSNGLSCSYINEESKHMKRIHKNIIINDYETIVKNYTKAVNAKVKVELNTKKLSYVDDLKEAVRHNNPAILLINSKCLTYQTPPAHLTEVGAMHAVIVYGVDDEKGDIYIYDSYVYDDMQNPIPFYKFKLSYKTFVENAYMYSLFDFSDSSDISKEEINELILLQMKNFIKESDNHAPQGIEAFEKCIEDIRLLKNLSNNEAKKEFNEVFYLFKIQLSFVNHYIQDWLIDSDINASLKQNAMDSINLLIADWNKYLMKMLIGSYMRNNKVIDRIIDSGLHLVKKQRRVINEIILIYGNE